MPFGDTPAFWILLAVGAAVLVAALALVAVVVVRLTRTPADGGTAGEAPGTSD